MCWRLLGKVCQSSGTGLERLLSAHAPLFDELLAQAHSAREPLVRDSALHCLLGLTHESAGLRWYYTHDAHTTRHTTHDTQASLLDLVRATLQGLTLRLCSLQAGRAQRTYGGGVADGLPQRESLCRGFGRRSPLCLGAQGRYVRRPRPPREPSVCFCTLTFASTPASVQGPTPSASPRRSTWPPSCPTFSRTRPRTRTSRSGRST